MSNTSIPVVNQLSLTRNETLVLVGLAKLGHAMFHGSVGDVTVLLTLITATYNNPGTGFKQEVIDSVVNKLQLIADVEANRLDNECSHHH